jgi:hypothetical protein
MNILLWVLQVLLALHTAMGALWKFSNSEQAASLQALPHVVWMGLCVLELACVVGLLLPALNKPLGRRSAPIAAAFIAAEMLLFTVVHFASGSKETGQVIYWLVVAALCAFVAWGRFVLKPFDAR